MLARSVVRKTFRLVHLSFASCLDEYLLRVDETISVRTIVKWNVMEQLSIVLRPPNRIQMFSEHCLNHVSVSM